nr:U32 family peptidase [Deltaproteobacteria bacterium]
MQDAIGVRAPQIGIASPLSDPDEVELLVSNGATEFYCGVAPSAWAARYGASWLNRRSRGRANLPSMEHVANLVEKVHAHGLPVRVTLNAPFYTGEQLADVLALAGEITAAGADGLIVSDVGLILALRERGVAADITLSSMAAMRNSGAAGFFRDLGVTRMVLPRHVRMSEVASLRAHLPDVALELFVLNDGCVYEEGHCATTHALGTFCLTEWEYALDRRDGAAPTDDERAAFDEAVDDYRRWKWHVNNCGSSFSDRGLPNGPCGLCAIWDLCDLGVSCLKIVGRDSPTVRKVRSLRLVKTIVEQVAGGGTREAAAEYAQGLRDTPELCGSGFMCYYRDAVPTGRGPRSPAGCSPSGP